MKPETNATPIVCFLGPCWKSGCVQFVLLLLFDPTRSSVHGLQPSILATEYRTKGSRMCVVNGSTYSGCAAPFISSTPQCRVLLHSRPLAESAAFVSRSQSRYTTTRQIRYLGTHKTPGPGSIHAVYYPYFLPLVQAANLVEEQCCQPLNTDNLMLQCVRIFSNNSEYNLTPQAEADNAL